MYALPLGCNHQPLLHGASLKAFLSKNFMYPRMGTTYKIPTSKNAACDFCYFMPGGGQRWLVGNVGLSQAVPGTGTGLSSRGQPSNPLVDDLLDCACSRAEARAITAHEARLQAPARHPEPIPEVVPTHCPYSGLNCSSCSITH